MLKREHYIEDIKKQMAIFQYKIGLETSLNHHNLKLYGENFFRDILNIIYPKADFINTNFLKSNFSAIDLICHETKKCIQITSNRTRDKIKDTIKAYKKSKYANYDIEIYYLLEKAKPKNIKDLEEELNIEDLSSKLKDSSNLMKNIDNLEVKELEQVWKLFKINDEFIRFLPKLKEKYLNNFSTISLLINDTHKAIEDIFINLAIIKEKKETKQDKNLIVREALLNSYEEIYKPKEPIEIKELINKAKKSLVYGKAGVGKTTLCKYIAYKWVKGELYSEFEYVIYISLREWKNKGLKGAIKDNYYSQDEDNISFNIEENRDKILFLFDGYDELKRDKKKTLISEIAHYGLTHYIITTRPYGYQRNDFRVDEHFETIGFTYENVKEYIEIFFKDNSDKSKSLKKFLQSNIGIKHIAYIPLMLEMICTLWQEKEFSDSLTMTELYSAVVENMLQKHSDKNRDDETVSEWENREDIKELLGKIAFYSLTKQNILFDGKFIRDTIGKNNLDFFKVSIVNSGFLKSDVKDKSLLGNNFEFLHLTFQEYFSALYVASLPKKEQSEIIRDWKFYPHMQMFFAFLGGLIEDKEFLLGEIENQPKDLMGFNEFSLLFNCVSEMKKLPKNRKEDLSKLFFYWFDFFIKNDLDYNLILDKAKLFSNFADDEFIDKLISFIKDKNINLRLKEKIIVILVYITKEKNQKIIDIFFNLIKKGNLPKYYHKDDVDCQEQYDYESMIVALVYFAKNNEKVFNKLVDCINDNSIDQGIRTTIAKSITYLYRYNDIINIEQMMEEEYFDACDMLEWLKNEALKAKRYKIDKNLIDSIISFIENKDIYFYFRSSVALYFSFLAKNNDEIIHALTNFIKNEKDIYVTGEIAQILAFLGINENIIIDTLIEKIKVLGFVQHFDNILNDTIEALSTYPKLISNPSIFPYRAKTS